MKNQKRSDGKSIQPPTLTLSKLLVNIVFSLIVDNFNTIILGKFY